MDDDDENTQEDMDCPQKKPPPQYGKLYDSKEQDLLQLMGEYAVPIQLNLESIVSTVKLQSAYKNPIPSPPPPPVSSPQSSPGEEDGVDLTAIALKVLQGDDSTDEDSDFDPNQQSENEDSESDDSDANSPVEGEEEDDDEDEDEIQASKRRVDRDEECNGKKHKH